MKRFSLIFIAVLLLVGCSGKQETKPDENKEPTTDTTQTEETSSNDNPTVIITMNDESIIEAELYPNVAPNTVNNFIALANSGFYDGVIFHRVIPGFMIQGGDPEGTGMGGPGYSIAGEFTSNNFTNNLKHERGVLSMARSRENDSAGSQFFIMHENSPHLDGDYAGFGKVTKGIEVVDKIVSVPTKNDRPNDDQIIKSIKVDTKGKTYDEPKKV